MNGWIVLLTSEIDTLIQTNIHTHTAKAAAKQALEAKQKEDRENLAKELEEKKARETAQRKESTAVNAAITESPSEYSAGEDFSGATTVVRDLTALGGLKTIRRLVT